MHKKPLTCGFLIDPANWPTAGQINETLAKCDENLKECVIEDTEERDRVAIDPADDG